MKKQATAVQYTIRGIPNEVDLALRGKAAQGKRSLNQVILDELTAATVGRMKRADFSDLAGPWTPDPAFDEILAAQRHIDSDKWK
jgi:plasmid stability protein